MSDFFGGIYGAQFPDVVMNSGPLPPSGRLPAPLHDTADARINYNSSLLGDINPYAYGEPGYQSSQSSYLNIPHKLQKVIPVIHLPEAKKGSLCTEMIEISHPIDDGDLAFVMRLNRVSIFCSGLKPMQGARFKGLGTAVDPFINLCTLNYILSGMQLGYTTGEKGGWSQFLHDLDPVRWKRDNAYVLGFDDLLHMVKNCIRPFGITRGSEKQGGQNEATMSPATWPVSFVTSLVLDGKEQNVVNIWHHSEVSAGDDLVLRFKRVPLGHYTLNHYYKKVVRANWSVDKSDDLIWQLVPDVFTLGDAFSENKLKDKPTPKINPNFNYISRKHNNVADNNNIKTFQVQITDGKKEWVEWQELGYWHIAKSQVMTKAYGLDLFYNNDCANTLKTNHLDVTFQPCFCKAPHHSKGVFKKWKERARDLVVTAEDATWKPKLRLETLFDEMEGQSRKRQPFGFLLRDDSPKRTREDLQGQAWQDDEDFLQKTVRFHAGDDTDITGSEDIGTMIEAPTLAIPGLNLKTLAQESEKPQADESGNKRKPPAKRANNKGSLLKTDGTSETNVVELL